MAAVKTKTKVRAEFKLENGVDGESNPIYKSKSIPSIKKSATPDQIYAVMSALKACLNQRAVAFYVSDIFNLENQI